MIKLVNVDGVDLRIHATGIKNNKPTVIIESRANTSTDYYHWLSKSLKRIVYELLDMTA